MRRTVHRPTPPLLTKAILRGRDRRGRRWAYDTDLKKRVPYGDVPGTDPAVTQETTPMTEQPRTDDFHRPLPAARVSARAAAPARQVSVQEHLWTREPAHPGSVDETLGCLKYRNALTDALDSRNSTQFLFGVLNMLQQPGMPELPATVRAAGSLIQQALVRRVTPDELRQGREQLRLDNRRLQDQRETHPSYLPVLHWFAGADTTPPSTEAFLYQTRLLYEQEACAAAQELLHRLNLWMISGFQIHHGVRDILDRNSYLRTLALHLQHPAAAIQEADENTDAIQAETRRQGLQLLQDILGNPFDPVPASRVPVDTDVRVLALAARDDIDARGQLDPARLAVLADALEEQGADERLVTALRPDGRPRPAGLWALRQVLEVNGERP